MDKVTFVDLWDNFTTVFGRVTNGRHDLKSLRSMIYDRKCAEEAYAKSLRKIEKNSNDLETSTSISLFWQGLKEKQEQMAAHHSNFAARCQEILETLDEVILEVKLVKTVANKNFNTSTNEKNTRRKKHDSAQEAYQNSVRNAEQATQNLQNAPHDTTEKGRSKLTSKRLKAVKSAGDAHLKYYDSVVALREAQKSHDKQLSIELQNLEAVERLRLKTMQDQMVKFGQAHIEAATANIQGAESIVKTSEVCTLEKDVEEFINSNITGNSRPHLCQYVRVTSTHPGLDAELTANFTETDDFDSDIEDEKKGLGMHGSGDDFKTDPFNSMEVREVSSQGFKPPPPSNNASASQSERQADSMEHRGSNFTTTTTNNKDGGDGNGFADFLGGGNGNSNSDGKDDGGAFGQTNSSFGSGSNFNNTALSNTFGSGSSSSNATDVASGSAGSTADSITSTTAYAHTLYKYESAEQDDLTFEAGEVIVLDEADEGAEWWSGSIGARHGIFPANFVSKCMTCMTKYDFSGQDGDELSFKKGERLVITGEFNDWYMGHSADLSRKGLFPITYVQVQ